MSRRRRASIVIGAVLGVGGAGMFLLGDGARVPRRQADVDIAAVSIEGASAEAEALEDSGPLDVEEASRRQGALHVSEAEEADQSVSPTTATREFQPLIADDSEWSRDMEQRVWTALSLSSLTFLSIESIACNWPRCQLIFTPKPGDPAAGNFAVELTLGVGFDESGVPLIKEMSAGQKEVRPGVKSVVVTFSTVAHYVGE